MERTLTRLTNVSQRHITKRQTSGRCRSNLLKSETLAYMIARFLPNPLKAIRCDWILSVSVKLDSKPFKWKWKIQSNRYLKDKVFHFPLKLHKHIRCRQYRWWSENAFETNKKREICLTVFPRKYFTIKNIYQWKEFNVIETWNFPSTANTRQAAKHETIFNESKWKAMLGERWL